MYTSAREWGIQPSEFWDMTIGEWLLEASHQWEKSEQGRHQKKKSAWLDDADLTREEWMQKYGLA
jgi:hypothetical protein